MLEVNGNDSPKRQLHKVLDANWSKLSDNGQAVFAALTCIHAELGPGATIDFGIASQHYGLTYFDLARGIDEVCERCLAVVAPTPDRRDRMQLRWLAQLDEALISGHPVNNPDTGSSASLAEQLSTFRNN